jgi:hypothetical protein
VRASLAWAAVALVTGCALDPNPVEGRVCFTGLDCVGSLGYSCNFDQGTGVDGGSAGRCVQPPEAGVDAALYDSGVRTMDAGDAGTDATTDAIVADASDAAPDDGGDASIDGGVVDTGTDGGGDAASNDAATDDAATDDAASDDAGTNDASTDDAGNDGG